MKSIRAFLRLLKEAPGGKLFWLFILMLLNGLTDGIGILLLVPLLETLQKGDGSQNGIAQHIFQAIGSVGLSPTPGGLLTMFLILVALRSTVQYSRDRLSSVVQNRLIDKIRMRCFSALLGVEWRWIAARRQSDHAALLLTDISRVGTGLNFGLSLLTALASMAAYLLAAFSLSPQMTILSLVSGGVVLLLLAGQRRRALELGHGLGIATRELHGNVQESLLGIKLAKILGNELRYLDRLQVTTSNLRRQQIEFSSSTSFSRALFQMGGALLLVIYLFVGLNLWHTPLPELLTLVLIFSRLIPIFSTAQQQFHFWLHALPALEDTERLLSNCQEYAEPLESPNAPPCLLADSIKLQGVTVQYADRDQPALDNVSVTFPAHTTTAIMGASGAGKSTLADLLMGLLTPDNGVVTVDGNDISGGSRRRWRSSVAYVPQEVFLFNDTIRSNLLWGKLDAGEDELRQALEHAAAEFVFQLPLGIDTVVGDGGVLLSGGERQRVALARALLKRPLLLILDEATSALDMENEARVRDAIENLHGNLTMVIIGHRLPTLENADQVLVLEEGRIKLQGTWDDVRR